MMSVVGRRGIALGAVLALVGVAGCAAGGGSSTLGVSDAVDAMAKTGLCSEPVVKFEEGGQTLTYLQGGSDYTRPSLTVVSCDSSATSLFIYDSQEEKALSRTMSCLTLSARHPELIDEGLANAEFETEWVIGANWEALVIDYSLKQFADTMGGQVVTLGEMCEPSIEEMLQVAANPAEQEPLVDLAVSTLKVSGLFTGMSDENLATLLDLSCLIYDPVQDNRDVLAKLLMIESGDPEPLLAAVINALELGDYSCPTAGVDSPTDGEPLDSSASESSSDPAQEEPVDPLAPIGDLTPVYAGEEYSAFVEVRRVLENEFAKTCDPVLGGEGVSRPDSERVLNAYRGTIEFQVLSCSGGPIFYAARFASQVGKFLKNSCWNGETVKGYFLLGEDYWASLMGPVYSRNGKPSLEAESLAEALGAQIWSCKDFRDDYRDN